MAEYYVSPSGATANSGAIGSPWNLGYALGGAGGTIASGDTIWVRGGSYASAVYNSSVSVSGRVVFRQYPGEQAIIGDRIDVNGANTWFWGLRVTNSRTTLQNLMGFDCQGYRTRIINCIIDNHSGNGIGHWSTAPDGQIYGSILWNNGFCGQDGGPPPTTCNSWGHGIYAQNPSGTTKLIKDNIITGTRGYGLHAYSESGQLAGFMVEGNIAYMNGVQSGVNLLVGGTVAVSNMTFVDNCTYCKEGDAHGVWIGMDNQLNATGIVKNNYIAFGYPTFRAFDWSNLTVSRNTIIGPQNNPGALIDTGGTVTSWQWGNNSVYGDDGENDCTHEGGGNNFAGWKTTTGLGDTDTYANGRPTGTYVVVRPNSYETQRGHVAIYNWDGAANVTVDVSSILSPGSNYSLYNAARMLDAPTTGTLSGTTLSFSMSTVTCHTPVVGSVTPSTGNLFQAFLLIGEVPTGGGGSDLGDTGTGHFDRRRRVA